jgi:hypothetical protein
MRARNCTHARGMLLARRAAAALSFAGLALLLVGACGSDPAEAVLGVETGLRPGVDFDAVRVLLRVDAEPVVDRTLTGAELGFPLEVDFPELEDGVAIDASVVASFGRTEVVARSVATTAVGGRKLLLRAPLEAACSGARAPDCAAGTTCAAGSCVDPFTEASELEDYSASWAAGSKDACGDGGEPVVFIGKGQADYLPIQQGETLQVEAGPQGGYHVWISARLKNLRQTGTVTEVRGRVAELDYDTPPYSVVFRLERDEGGFCKVYGMRFQLDGPEMPIASLLGKDLDVTVTVSDPDGASATAQTRVRLSDDFL